MTVFTNLNVCRHRSMYFIHARAVKTLRGYMRVAKGFFAYLKEAARLSGIFD